MLAIIIVIGFCLVSVLGLWLWGERGRLLRPSTRKFIRESGGWRRIFSFNILVNGYVYARWTNQFQRLLIHHIAPRLGPRGRKWFSDHQHHKVLTHEHAKAIINLDRDIPLRDLEQIIPYPMARNLVLKGPPDVAAYECCCRHIRPNPCRPTRVCMVIGQPFVDFILEHHPGRSSRLNRTEALQLLEDEHKRGHVHAAEFKSAFLDRFYVICNCCKCCCGGIEVMNKYGVRQMVSSGFVAETKSGLCDSCGACVSACPFGALILEADNVRMIWEKCMGCGVCIDLCPNNAKSLVRDERKGVPLDVGLL